MGKKHRKKKRTQSDPLAQAMFSVGAIVRVKSGTMDPVFAVIPLGGWIGTIQNVDEQAHPKLYQIRWNQDTLDQMHPVYLKRCQRDDLEMDNMWLAEDELNRQRRASEDRSPTNLITRPPLTNHDQDDRIRAIFELTSDDPLPFVDDGNLRKYHRYLATHLFFPVPGQVQGRSRPIS